MFTQNHQLATVSMILPSRPAGEVARRISAVEGAHALIWQARGTLLHDHWLKKWVPPVSPAKKMMQMIVPNSQVDEIVNMVIEVGKLNQQATGAVFSTPHDHAYIGSGFYSWPGDEIPTQQNQGLSNSLTALYCIVNHQESERVSKAAINAGAHGPIVYYCEGRGLRDRLGWLRITKEHEKEVLMVICDESDVEDVFDAMAKAGGLHLPGRGFMFRLNIDKGMFNIPNRATHHHYEASMQQVINAIDHLQGHSHWRDQTVFDVAGGARGTGLSLAPNPQPVDSQTCLAAVVSRNQMHLLVDLMLDQGVPGLNFSFARFTSFNEKGTSHINAEYALVRSITRVPVAQEICSAIETKAEQAGLTDLCLTTNCVERVATYVPGAVDHRNQDAA